VLTKNAIVLLGEDATAAEAAAAACVTRHLSDFGNVYTITEFQMITSWKLDEIAI
jgi:hypothetical protein